MSYFVFVLCINVVYKFPPPLWQARTRLLSTCVSLIVALSFICDLHFV